MAVGAILTTVGKKIATQVAVNTAAKGAKKSGGWGRFILIILASIIGIIFLFISAIIGVVQIITVDTKHSSETCVLFPDFTGDDPPTELEEGEGNNIDQSATVPVADSGAPAPDSTGNIVVPLPAGTYSIPVPGGLYGPRKAPTAGASTWHKGLDFAAKTGTPIIAATNGTITNVSYLKSSPPTPYIDLRATVNGQIITTRYEHMSQINVAIGQTVQAGDTIGLVGEEGVATGPHLHFEVWLGTPGKDNHTDPQKWLETQGASTLGVDSLSDSSIVYANVNLNATGLEVCQLNSSNGSNGTNIVNGPWGGHSNGEIPDRELASPSFDSNVKLRGDAATALNDLNNAFTTQFGHSLTVIQSYTSISDQSRCISSPTQMCPAPGTSNLGWGLAVNLSSGIESFTTEQHKWMEINAQKFGWILPSWAQQNGSKPSPGHWEYTGTQIDPSSSSGKTPDGAKALASDMMSTYGWDNTQFVCLDNIWTRESGWNYLATNKQSGAYGIPQSLPGSKMATVGNDWQSNPETQIVWGLNYIQSRYNSPCAAWQYWQQHNYY